MTEMPVRATKATARECEVARLVAGGLTNKEIASELFLTEATIKSHIARMCRRMDALNRAHLVTRAVERGIVVPSRGPVHAVSRERALRLEAEADRDRWRTKYTEASERIRQLMIEIYVKGGRT